MIKRKLTVYNFKHGRQELKEEIIELQCNRCHCVMSNDDWKFYDTLHWEDVGGYGSYFGDGTVLSLTLCPVCLDELVGDYIIKD